MLDRGGCVLLKRGEQRARGHNEMEITWEQGRGHRGVGALFLLPAPSCAQAGRSTTQVLGCLAHKNAYMFQKALVGGPSLSLISLNCFS